MLRFCRKLVHNITFNRLMLWVLTILIGIVFYTAYENRVRLFSTFSESPTPNQVGLTFSTSPETEHLMQQLVLADRTIIGINIMSADLRLNEAKTIFFFGDDDSLVKMDAESKKYSNNRVQLFTNIDDSNSDVIRLINGKFTCMKFTDTVTARLYPELIDHVKMICRSSIPSYYGYFSGFIGVFLNENLSPERQGQLKLVIDKAATDIYFRDVIPTQKFDRGGEKRVISP